MAGKATLRIRLLRLHSKGMLRLLALTLSMTLAVAQAADLPEAEDQLAQGEWQSAAQIAETVGGVDGLNLAAKAYALGASTDQAPAGTLDKALNAARSAVRLAPQNAMAHFQLAQALGRQAQQAGLIGSAKLAGQVKAELLTAIRLNPNIPQPYAALGVWNAEISAKGALPALLLGASREEALKNFEQALRLDPLTMSYLVEYGRALLRMPGQALHARGLQQLQFALSLTPRTFWERDEQRKARELIAGS